MIDIQTHGVSWQEGRNIYVHHRIHSTMSYNRTASAAVATRFTRPASSLSKFHPLTISISTPLSSRSTRIPPPPPPPPPLFPPPSPSALHDASRAVSTSSLVTATSR